MWQTTKCGEQGEGSRASWGNEQTAATSETAVVNHYILTVSGRELVAGGRVVSSVDELAVSAQDRGSRGSGRGVDDEPVQEGYQWSRVRCGSKAQQARAQEVTYRSGLRASM